MLRKAFLVTTLVLLTYDISHAQSDIDVQVCEAQPTDDLRIECYRDLMLNPSCHVLQKKKQLPCFRRSALSTVLGRKETESPPEKKPEDPGDDFFGQPQRLCSALSNMGLGTSGWAADTSSPENQWRCLSDPVSFGASGAEGSKNEIRYQVSGSTTDRASEIRLSVNINNPSGQKQALAKLDAATKGLFRALPEHLPIDLALALRHKKPISVFTESGTVNLILETGEKESYSVTLTDTKITPDQSQLRAQAAEDFESCRRATARAVGYSDSQISGNGVPLQGPGFKSYRFSGRGTDWLTCQVYPGGKYKIEAAINGKYPSKYVAEGEFWQLHPLSPPTELAPDPGGYGVPGRLQAPYR